MPYKTLSQSNNHYSDNSGSYFTKTYSTLKPPKNLSNLFNEFINFLLSKIKTLKILTVSIMILTKFKVLII